MKFAIWFIISYVGVLGFANGQNTIDVTQFGAVGDGKNDDTQAFLKAWGQACATSGSQTLLIPNGKSFLLQPLVFQGPCKSNIHVQLQGTLVGTGPSNWSGNQKDTWIRFNGVDGLLFEGNGKIDGQGEPWWKAAKPQDDKNRPSALVFNSCDNLQVKGFTSINSPRNHIGISSCTKVMISNVNLIAPDESPNTDGIDIAGSSQVTIRDSFMGTGDDCIAINGDSNGINITNVNCGPGHGLSIGSLGKNGDKDIVENVRIEKCTFNKTDNGARIKTWPGGSGYAKGITFEDITLIETKNPIVINQFYGHCHPNCKGGNSAVEVSNVNFIGIRGTSATEVAINLNCSNVKPCNGIVLERIDITSATKGKINSSCNNAQVVSRSTNPPVKCI